MLRLFYSNPYPFTAKILFNTPLRGARRRKEVHAKKCGIERAADPAGPTMMEALREFSLPFLVFLCEPFASLRLCGEGLFRQT
jgi:hypothetical protein